MLVSPKEGVASAHRLQSNFLGAMQQSLGALQLPYAVEKSVCLCADENDMQKAQMRTTGWMLQVKSWFDPWRKLFSKDYRPELVLAFFIPFLQQWTGERPPSSCFSHTASLGLSACFFCVSEHPHAYTFVVRAGINRCGRVSNLFMTSVPWHYRGFLLVYFHV